MAQIALLQNLDIYSLLQLLLYPFIENINVMCVSLPWPKKQLKPALDMLKHVGHASILDLSCPVRYWHSLPSL